MCLLLKSLRFIAGFVSWFTNNSLLCFIYINQKMKFAFIAIGMTSVRYNSRFH